MRPRTPFVLVALLLLTAYERPAMAGAQWEQRTDLEKHFSARGVRGSFVLYDLKKNRYLCTDRRDVDRGTLPASTFKIFNALVALETGAVADENEIIAWDGVDRGRKAWNQDHSLKSAMSVSAVWFYQEVARRAGQRRMHHFVDKARYGNRDIGDRIDRFWLDGRLRISPRQQIDFLTKLYRNDLPFSERSMRIVKQIIVVDQTPTYTMRAKTGWAAGIAQPIGWYVGYVERGDDVYFFATRIDITRDEDAAARVDATRAILTELGILDP